LWTDRKGADEVMVQFMELYLISDSVEAIMGDENVSERATCLLLPLDGLWWNY
jgi:hypothetical protein